MKKKKEKLNNKIKPETGYFSLTDASKFSPYSQEYLSLLARQGKIYAKKFGRNWFVTREAVENYLTDQGIKIILPKNLFNASYKGRINKPFNFFQPYQEPGLKEPPIFKTLGSFEYQEKPKIIFTQEQIGEPEKRIEESTEPIKITEEVKENLEETKKETPKEIPTEERIFERLIAALESRLSNRGVIGKIEELNQLGDQHFRSPKKALIIAVAAIALIFILVGGISFGNLDQTFLAINNFFKDADTLQGYRPGTHANEVLLLNKEGNISIYGHIETQGQLRSWVEGGVAPIVVDSTTTVKNLSVEMLDGLKKEDFTLAFVTKNGNITYENVKLEGEVEVGKTLLVKGATKLLDSLFVYGTLGAFGGINTYGANLNLGKGTIVLTNQSLIKNLNAEMLGGYRAADFDLDLILSHGDTSSRSIYVGGIWTPTGVFSDTLISQRFFQAYGSFRLGEGKITDIGIINTRYWSVDSGGTINTKGGLTVAGLATFYKGPSSSNVSGGVVYVNPSSAGVDNTLLGIAVGGTEKFKVDAEGDIITAGKLSVSGSLSSLASTNFEDDVTLLSPANLILNAGNITVSQLSVPTSTSATATSSGSLAAGTYYYKITALNSNGETTGSNEVSAVVDGAVTTAVYVSWSSVTGASSYRIYRATSTNNQNIYFEDADGSPYIDTGTTSVAGSVPTGNTTGGRGTFSGSLTVSATTVAHNILPETDSLYDLGSSVYRWQNVYVNNLVALSTTTLNTLTVLGTTSLAVNEGNVGIGTSTPASFPGFWHFHLYGRLFGNRYHHSGI